MAEFVEIIDTKRRICETHKECYGCELCIGDKNGGYMSCSTFMECCPQNAEEIIMNWAKEHPIMTNKDKLKEVFGYDFNFLHKCKGLVCPDDKDGNCISCNDCKFLNFWNKEYKTPKGVE